MDTREICFEFQTARNKRTQIPILAELTGSDIETICEILKDNDLYVKIGRCSVCGKLYRAYMSNKCPECDMRMREQRAQKEAYKNYIRGQIKDRKEKKKRLIRELMIIDRELNELREELA